MPNAGFFRCDARDARGGQGSGRVSVRQVPATHAAIQCSNPGFVELARYGKRDAAPDARGCTSHFLNPDATSTLTEIEGKICCPRCVTHRSCHLRCAPL